MLTEKTKKILLIAAFVASVIGIGIALYFLFFRPVSQITIVPGEGEEPSIIIGADGLPISGSGQPTTGTTTTTPSVLPEASEIAAGGITKTIVLTTSSVESVTVSQNGDGMNYYDPRDSRFYSIDADGAVIKLSNKQFPDVDNVAWNSDSSKAVIEFPDGSNVVYDFTAETQVTLPKHWEDFEFSPTQDEIVAKSIGVDPNNRALVISKSDGSQVQSVQALGENADKVQINPSPSDQIIAFANTADSMGFGRTTILPVGKNQENFKGLVVEGLGFDSLWNPRGDIILYSVYGDTSDYKPLLWVVDGTVNSLGDDRRSLSLNTWVDKCVFASSSVAYCAVPQEMASNAGMQRSAYEMSSDDLYKIDLSNNRSTLVARPEISTPMTNLQVSDDGAYVFYTNNMNGRLEMIRLK
ncbi:MAG: hypothetical protein UX09_C0029G0016 [Candidatus Uhrbacteria bacterium GW2011_GWE2_45_35]|uniref:Uncharacterized protein n=1 Tax=Candidatus Uhrbacteria bacterium GW2011_GWE2_45_35 TaxID=1618993 RepID=A0A0G1MHC3_9BACT|nr:MAG: hypothetical protein UX09_C0029G0016 [Candidatus Uhrbacteria bacterium GW2011_GWE2_45_35]